MCYDGEKEIDPIVMDRLLTNTARVLQLRGIGANKPRIVPGCWQHDSWTCGWLCLHVMECICLGQIKGDSMDPQPPLSAKAFTEDLNAVVACLDAGP